MSKNTLPLPGYSKEIDKSAPEKRLLHQKASQDLYNSMVGGVQPEKTGLAALLSSDKRLETLFDHFNSYDTKAKLTIKENGQIESAEVTQLRDKRPMGEPATTVMFDDEGMANLKQETATRGQDGLVTSYSADFGPNGATVVVGFQDVDKAFNFWAREGARDKNKAQKVNSTGKDYFRLTLSYDNDHKLTSALLNSPDSGDVPIKLGTTHSREDDVIKRNGVAEAIRAEDQIVKLGEMELHVKLLDVLNQSDDMQNEAKFVLVAPGKEGESGYGLSAIPNIELPRTGFYDSQVRKGLLDVVDFVKPQARRTSIVEPKKMGGGIARANDY